MAVARKPIICLMGATATGKTALAMELSDRLPCEIISVDSAMIYRGMDIGTAKPSPEELARYPHRLVDILDPAEAYSAARFAEDAKVAIDEIHAAGRIPLLVGGTMLYFKALLEGMASLPEADPDVRARLLAEAEAEGWPALHARLAKVDPESAARIHPNDPQRLQRALEVWEVSGRSLTEHWRAQQASACPWDALQLVVEVEDRALLHRRIAKRFRQMLELGFEDEVRRLHARGDLNPAMPSVRCVGYRQMWAWLEGELEYGAMVERAIIATRQLAKRQMTWLRSWPGAVRLEATLPRLVERALQLGEEHLL